MAELFVDGFDKYGPAGMLASNSTNLSAYLAQEWTNVYLPNGENCQLVAALSGPGKALRFNGSVQYGSGVSKTLPTNATRLIVGFRFQVNLNGGGYSGVTFGDAGTAQFAVRVNQNTGQITAHTGPMSTGTLLATASTSVLSGSSHYMEIDVTFGTSSAYQVWIDGVSVISGTGATKVSSNSYANTVRLSMGVGDSLINTTGFTSGNYFIIDDVYIFDTTGSVCNAALLTNPRIETQWASSDVQTQFTASAGIMGWAYNLAAGNNAPGANKLFIRRVQAPVACTLNSISIVPQATSAGAKFKGVVYADSSGAIGSLLSSGTEVVGATAGTTLVGPLVTPQSLTAGAYYWIGFITDTSVALYITDTNLTGSIATNTYTSGAPATPTMTTGQANWEMWGNFTGTAVNWPLVVQSPVVGDTSATTSSTVGNEDLFGFPALSTTPLTIHTVAVKAAVRKDSGTRTVDLRMKSSGTSGSGSSTGQGMAATYGYIASFFNKDPNTSAAWAAAALNAASSGIKVVT